MSSTVAAQLIGRDQCHLCGCRVTCRLFGRVFVTAGGLRTQGTTVVWSPSCPECGWRGRSDQLRWHPSPETLAAITRIGGRR